MFALEGNTGHCTALQCTARCCPPSYPNCAIRPRPHTHLLTTSQDETHLCFCVGNLCKINRKVFTFQKLFPGAVAAFWAPFQSRLQFLIPVWSGLPWHEDCGAHTAREGLHQQGGGHQAPTHQDGLRHQHQCHLMEDSDEFTSLLNTQ